MELSPDALKGFVSFILGGGLLLLVTQFVRARASLRSGARANTREVLKDLAEQRDAAEDRAAAKTRDGEFWRNIAGAYGYQMRSAGLTPDPPDPVPPSARLKHPARRKREPEDTADGR